MAQSTEEPENSLPDPELNPLLNPLLAAHMGRWAEVYFTAPPEKRGEAVAELIRELEKEDANAFVAAEPRSDRLDDFETDGGLSNAHLPPIASEPESVPYRYRVHVGVLLAILLLVLVYMAWRGTKAFTGRSQTAQSRAVPPATLSSQPASNAQPQGLPTDSTPASVLPEANSAAARNLPTAKNAFTAGAAPASSKGSHSEPGPTPADAASRNHQPTAEQIPSRPLNVRRNHWCGRTRHGREILDRRPRRGSRCTSGSFLVVESRR